MGQNLLYINRRSKKAVASISNPAIFSPLAPIVLYDKESFQIHVWNGTGNTSAPFFEVPDLDGYSLRMSVCTTGAAPTTLASETNWTWDATNKCFTGTIDLSQSALVTEMTDEAEIDVKLDIKLVDADGNRTTILHENIKVVRVADVVATPSEPHSDTYLTADEINNMFVKRRHTGTIVLVSSDGTSQVTLSCDAAKLVERGAPVV